MMMKKQVFVIADPTLFEIREMLDAVALDSDLTKILPAMEGADMASWMQLGWCYLWYDSETLEPLGYTLFEFKKAKERFPFFHFAGTRFVQPWHILKITRAMRSVMVRAFKNQVRAYIGQERIQIFAEANGFRRCVKDNTIWIKG